MENEIKDDYKEEINNWDELAIDAPLLRGIYAHGFEKPSPIQQRAIKPIIDGRDIIAQAQSGTGKTATFTIGALSRINLSENAVQVLILSPTHELSYQTSTVIGGIGGMMDNLKIKNLVGGSSIDEDARLLQEYPPHIITGCPGRVYDMLRRRNINPRTIKLIILDEPFSGFDPINAQLLVEEISLLKKNGASIIFSTHRMDSVDQLCDHISLINKSHVLLDGAVSEVKNKYKQNKFSVVHKSSFNIPPQSFEQIESNSKTDGVYETIIKLHVGVNSNTALFEFLQNNEVLSFNEVIPSMEDIFILAVENSK